MQADNRKVGDMNEAVYCQNLEGLLSWFRNGIPQFSIPTKTLQAMYHSLTAPLTSASGWRGELEAQKVKVGS